MTYLGMQEHAWLWFKLEWYTDVNEQLWNWKHHVKIFCLARSCWRPDLPFLGTNISPQISALLSRWFSYSCLVGCGFVPWRVYLLVSGTLVLWWYWGDECWNSCRKSCSICDARLVFNVRYNDLYMVFVWPFFKKHLWTVAGIEDKNNQDTTFDISKSYWENSRNVFWHF